MNDKANKDETLDTGDDDLLAQAMDPPPPRKVPRRSKQPAGSPPATNQVTKKTSKKTSKPASKKTSKPASKKTSKPASKPASKKTSKPATAAGPDKVSTPDKKPAKRKVKLEDGRKLTKKGQSTVRERWSAANSGKSRVSLMQGLVSSARDRFGADRVFGSREELDQLAIGIPVPALAFEFAIANDVFPLSSVLMLAGSWGSCKSALSYEFFRWFHENDGVPVHIDTEDKFDGAFACDIMRVPHDYMPIISNRANSTEQMQQILTHYLKQMQKSLIGTKNDPGPGKTIPCCFCIDSLAGSSSEEVQDKIMDKGNAGRSHPVEALKNKIYLSGIKKQFENWPFTLLVVNHLKEKADDMGNTRQYTLGGESFNFHESFEIHNSVWRRRFKNAQFEGVGIRLTCSKNSFGPTGRSIKTRFLWWVDDDENGVPQDRFLWDWNWSLCTLLNEADGIYKERLQQRGLTITCRSPQADIECLANFRAIGMGKDEYLPFQEVGQMIQENEEVCDRIRDALNIKRRYQLDRPYDELVAEHLETVQ